MKLIFIQQPLLKGPFNNYVTLKLPFRFITNDHKTPLRYVPPDTDTPPPSFYDLFFFFEAERTNKEQRNVPTHDTSTHVFNPNCPGRRGGGGTLCPPGGFFTAF